VGTARGWGQFTFLQQQSLSPPVASSAEATITAEALTAGSRGCPDVTPASAGVIKTPALNLCCPAAVQGGGLSALLLELRASAPPDPLMLFPLLPPRREWGRNLERHKALVLHVSCHVDVSSPLDSGSTRPYTQSMASCFSLRQRQEVDSRFLPPTHRERQRSFAPAPFTETGASS
jgi:hypothetical protein